MGTLKGQYCFEKDLPLGDKGEDIVRKYLESLNYKFLEYNYDKRYDLIMEHIPTGKIIQYEVKTDYYRDTGNIPVEVGTRNKPSGVNVTTADFYLTYFYHLRQLWIIKPEKLKEIIVKERFHFCYNSGDDGSKTIVAIKERDIVRKYFKVHKI